MRKIPDYEITITEKMLKTSEVIEKHSPLVIDDEKDNIFFTFEEHKYNWL